MGLRARLHDGDRSLEQLRAHLTKSSLPNLFSLCGRALQVDGNLGGSAAIAEMLLQSHRDLLHLLPALPAEWSEGAVQGLRARGGFDVDLAWSGGRATQATIRAHLTGTCRIQVAAVARVLADGRAVRLVHRGPDIVEFPTAAGRTYRLEFR